MFKTDKGSLEALSFHFDERGVATLKRLLEELKMDKLLTIPQSEAERAIKGLEAIGKLKLEGKIYAFHVYDSFAEEDCNEGVELYLRQGDGLREYCVPSSRDFVYSTGEIAERLKERGKTQVYTGPLLDSGFLGLSRECDKDDPVVRSILQDDEIEDLKEKGIEVVKLDCLI